MRRFALLFSALALTSQPAHAEDLPQDIFDRAVCSAFGEGFRPIAGTDTCIEISGSVSVETGFVSGGIGSPGRVDSLKSRARGSGSVETRTETDFGLVRSYIELDARLGERD